MRIVGCLPIAAVLALLTPICFAPACLANEAGAQRALFITGRDSVTIVSLDGASPKIEGRLSLPASPCGPNGTALAPDGRYALVTSGDKQTEGAIAPDSRVAVIDLTSAPAKASQQLDAGQGACGVAISPDGFALVTNRLEGTLSLFTIGNGHIEPGGKIDLGNAKAGPAGIAVAPDGHLALLAREGDSLVSLLHLDKGSVAIDPHALTTGTRPSAVAISRDGTLAAVTNLGRNEDDIGTVSLIDLSAEPLKIIETVSVGKQPAGLAFSPDARVLAVGVASGVKKGVATGGPALVIMTTKAKHLKKVASAPLPDAASGIAFANTGEKVAVQVPGDKSFLVFQWNRGKLKPAEDPANAEGVQ